MITNTVDLMFYRNLRVSGLPARSAIYWARKAKVDSDLAGCLSKRLGFASE